MRLSEYLQDTVTYQDSLELLLFHGTHSGHLASLLDGIGIPEFPETPLGTDFGPGFYMTGFAWQAIAWAKKRAQAANLEYPDQDHAPILVMSKVRLKKLRRIPSSRTLIIDEYNATWASTIRAGRSGKKLPYDWICGRCADSEGTQFPPDTWPEDDEKLARLLTPQKNTKMYHYEQIWFGNLDIIKDCLTQTFIIDLKTTVV